MPDTDDPATNDPVTDDLAIARWQLATLTGRLRCVEDERDAAVRDRDRTHELVRKLRRSRSYRLGRILTDLARDPVRNAPALARRAAHRAARRVRKPPPVRKQRRVVPPPPARVYVAVGLSHTASHDLVRALRQRIVVDGDHLPVVFTDHPDLSDLRLPGVILEYLPDPETWSRHDPAEDWESLLAGRVAQLCRAHGANRAVVIDPRDPPTLARLL